MVVGKQCRGCLTTGDDGDARLAMAKETIEIAMVIAVHGCVVVTANKDNRLPKFPSCGQARIVSLRQMVFVPVPTLRRKVTSPTTNTASIRRGLAPTACQNPGHTPQSQSPVPVSCSFGPGSLKSRWFLTISSLKSLNAYMFFKTFV